MYCPSCGSENSKDQRFCRACGLHLQTISQVVAHQLNAKESFAPTRQESRSIWQNPLLYGFLMIMFGLTVIFIGKRALGEQLVADIGTLISVVGVTFFILKGLFLLNQSRASIAAPAKDPPRADTTTELSPLLEAKEQPSVTEFTTRNFDPVYAERNAPKASTTSGHSDS